jgi:hypothetical protein
VLFVALLVLAAQPVSDQHTNATKYSKSDTQYSSENNSLYDGVVFCDFLISQNGSKFCLDLGYRDGLGLAWRRYGLHSRHMGRHGISSMMNDYRPADGY